MADSDLCAEQLDLEGVEDDFLGRLDNLGVDAVGREQEVSISGTSLVCWLQLVLKLKLKLGARAG